MKVKICKTFADEITYMICNVKPKVIFVEVDVLPKIQNLCKIVDESITLIPFSKSVHHYITVEDLLKPTGLEKEYSLPNIIDPVNTIALIMCSSGTTGCNKGIQLSHAIFNDKTK